MNRGGIPSSWMCAAPDGFQGGYDERRVDDVNRLDAEFPASNERSRRERPIRTLRSDSCVRDARGNPDNRYQAAARAGAGLKRAAPTGRWSTRNALFRALQPGEADRAAGPHRRLPPHRCSRPASAATVGLPTAPVVDGLAIRACENEQGCKAAGPPERGVEYERLSEGGTEVTMVSPAHDRLRDREAGDKRHRERCPGCGLHTSTDERCNKHGTQPVRHGPRCAPGPHLHPDVTCILHGHSLSLKDASEWLPGCVFVPAPFPDRYGPRSIPPCAGTGQSLAAALTYASRDGEFRVRRRAGRRLLPLPMRYTFRPL